MNEEKVNEETTEGAASEKSYFGMTATQLAGLVQEFIKNKDSVKDIVVMFKPIIGEVLDLAIDTVGPEFYKVMSRVAIADVRVKKEVYDEYLKLGFNEDQAYYMMSISGQGSKAASGMVEAASKAVSSK